MVMFKKRGVVREQKGFFGRHKLAIAVTTLMGTIIGAGILGLPYVIAQTGFIYGLLLLIVLGVAFLFINLFMGEIVLRTKEQHQLPGYAEKYLGRWGKGAMLLTLIIAIYGALTAYLIGEGATLRAIFDGGSPQLYTLLFFALGFFIVYRGIKATGKAELFLISLLVLVVILIGVFSFDKINPHNLLTRDISMLFVPYGVILFAYLGFASIPELQEELGKDKKKLKKAILIGSVLPILIYILFTLVVVGIVGWDNFNLLQPNERIATIALSIYSIPWLGLLANFLAVLSMFTSFLALSIILLDTYEFDLKFPKWTSLLLTFAVPLTVSFSNLTSFISILGFSGAVTGGFNIILLVLIYWKAKEKGDRIPEYSLGKNILLGILLIAMAVLGIIYQFVF